MTLPNVRRGVVATPILRTNGPAAVRIEPWNDFELMDRVFDSFFRGQGAAEPQRVGGYVELYETPEELVAMAFVPGFGKDSFEIEVTSSTLSVQSERKALVTLGENVTAHSRRLGAAQPAGFKAESNLPVEIDPDKVRATYTDGVLEIHLPKLEAAKARQIKVETPNN